MIIVDTSALICLLYQEPEAAAFTSIMAREGGALKMSAANYAEAGIVIDANDDEPLSERLDQLIALLGIEIEPVTHDHALIARRAYRSFGKGYHVARLNFGDCFAYALAKAEDAPLLFKGNDFAKTDVAAAI